MRAPAWGAQRITSIIFIILVTAARPSTLSCSSHGATPSFWQKMAAMAARLVCKSLMNDSK